MNAKPKLQIAKPKDVLGDRLDAERKLIRCAFIGNEEVRQSCGWLKPERFHDELMAEFWRRFVSGEEPGAVFFELGLHRVHQHIIDDDEYVTYYEAPTFARLVARGAYIDDINPLTARLAQAVTQADFPTAQDIIRQIAELTPQSERPVRTAYDAGESFLKLLDEPDRSIPTWIGPLDDATGGLERQTLSVLAARPSMGKSSLAFQIARNVVANGSKVLFVSLEMAEANLWARAACGLAGTTWQDVRRKRITEAQRDKLEKVCFSLMNKYTDRLMIHDGQASTDTVWEIVAAQRPALVVVDHLRCLADRGDDEVKRLGAITWRMKQLAKTLDCHCMILAQLNRQPDARGDDKRPTLTDLRDSGQIEENADLVLMMFREDYYKRENAKTGSGTEIWVRKARDGVRDVQINLSYDLRKQWFTWAGAPVDDED